MLQFIEEENSYQPHMEENGGGSGNQEHHGGNNNRSSILLDVKQFDEEGNEQQ